MLNSVILCKRTLAGCWNFSQQQIIPLETHPNRDDNSCDMKSILVFIAGGLLLLGCATMLPPSYSLVDAVQKGDIQAVKKHLDAGVSVNARVETYHALLGSTGTTTPLHQAAYFNRKEITELLISKGADVNAFAQIAWTPLDVAIKRQHPEITALLVKHGGKKGKELKSTGDALKESFLNILK